MRRPELERYLDRVKDAIDDRADLTSEQALLAFEELAEYITAMIDAERAPPISTRPPTPPAKTSKRQPTYRELFSVGDWVEVAQAPLDGETQPQ